MKQIKTYLAVALLLLLSGYCTKEEKIPVKGLINFIAGEVFIIRETGEKVQANVGDEIIQGIKVQTIGDKSFADIYFGENAIKVLGNTTVDIKQLIENSDSSNRQIKFNVEQGKLFSRVSQKLAKGDIYEVTTPTATAGVRGTEFIVAEEEGKSNVACIAGLVEVLNNSLKDSQPVMLDAKEETDIVPGENMVKKQISEDKLRMLNIIREIKEMQQEIRRKFEIQREEIRKHVVDQREKDKVMVQEQKEKDRALVDAIKGKTQEAGQQAVGDAKDKMQEVKVDKESVKPEIDKDKFKINKDQFKLNKDKETVKPETEGVR